MTKQTNKQTNKHSYNTHKLSNFVQFRSQTIEIVARVERNFRLNIGLVIQS